VFGVLLLVVCVCRGDAEIEGDDVIEVLDVVPVTEGSDVPGLGPIPDAGPGMSEPVHLQQHSAPVVKSPLEQDMQALWNAAENNLKQRRAKATRVEEIGKLIKAAQENISVLSAGRDAANIRILELVKLIGEEVVPMENPPHDEPEDDCTDAGGVLSENNSMDARIIEDPSFTVPTPLERSMKLPDSHIMTTDVVQLPTALEASGEIVHNSTGYEGSGNANDVMELMPLSPLAHNNISFEAMELAANKSEKIIRQTQIPEEAFVDKEVSTLSNSVAWAVMNQLDTKQLENQNIPEIEEIVPEVLLNPPEKHETVSNVVLVPENDPNYVMGCCVDKSTDPHSFVNTKAGDCLQGIGLTTFHFPGTSCDQATAIFYPEYLPILPPANITMDPPGLQTVVQKMNGLMASRELSVTTNNDLYAQVSGFKPDNQMEEESAKKFAKFAMPEIHPIEMTIRAEQDKLDEIAQLTAIPVAQPPSNAGTPLDSAAGFIIRTIAKAVTPVSGNFQGLGMPEKK